MRVLVSGDSRLPLLREAIERQMQGAKKPAA
jgi:hypothetical protein